MPCPYSIIKSKEPDFKDYLIFYRIQDDRVEIPRVLHGARDLEGILSNLDREI